ncbi:discoidin domain-containing protein [Roseiarcaceae bacterium H3SJ34-1]|uniref:discoidin domain-containing protein n=1 Tax=Terripilifer ovatus TaxID=3032367 RepID=UPI003AB91CAC|nr:discoidin domain-containing protein [Roseiarcaceae bacterium H3SJ34-1]
MGCRFMTFLAATVFSTALAMAAQGSKDAKPAQPRPRAAGEKCSVLRGQTGTDFYCASSVLAPQSGSSYGVDHLFSNKTGEAWVEGKPGQGIGQWITIDFKAPREVKALIIRNGYQKDSETFSKNSRISRLRLVFSEGETRAIAVPDTMDLQTIAIDPPVRSFWVQFIIDDVYPGSAYSDTAISKLFVTSEPVR